MIDFKALTSSQKNGIYYIIASILFKYIDDVIVLKLSYYLINLYYTYYIQELIALTLIIFGIKQFLIDKEVGIPYTKAQLTGIALLLATIVIPVAMSFINKYNAENTMIDELTTIYYKLPLNFIITLVLAFFGINFLLQKGTTENEYITNWTNKK